MSAFFRAGGTRSRVGVAIAAWYDGRRCAAQGGPSCGLPGAQAAAVSVSFRVGSGGNATLREGCRSLLHPFYFHLCRPASNGNPPFEVDGVGPCDRDQYQGTTVDLQTKVGDRELGVSCR